MMSNGKSIFERHPKLTIILVVLPALLLIDLIAGIFFIPEQHNDFRCYSDYYHHGMLPNRETTTVWGDRTVPYFTNSLGFKDRESRTIPLRSSKTRVLLLGDSFTEGVGLTFDETFAGYLDRHLPPETTELLNAGVIGYSPRLYYLKAKYLLEVLGLDVQELLVFIDMSDIHDEILYRDFQPREAATYRELFFSWHRKLKGHSFLGYTLFNLIHEDYNRKLARIHSDLPWLTGIENEQSHIREFFQNNQFLNDLWSRNEDVYRKLGVPGLALAEKNMHKLVELCREHGVRLTIFVHPWQHQIRSRDLENRQVLFWRRFCERYDVPFVNLFPLFITSEDPARVCEKYFIDGDIHWNSAGHQLVGERVLELFAPSSPRK